GVHTTAAPVLPAWARWLGLAAAVERGLRPLRDEVPALRGKVDAMLVGYDMGLHRLERALHEQGLERIVCVGQPFDPERMGAIEVVRARDGVAAEVWEEVRRGYLWGGGLFRFAQVRVAVGESRAV